MESEPENQFPRMGEISWHDITLEMIQEKIDENELVAAKILAEARIEGVTAAMVDIDDELQKAESTIGPTSWEHEKELLKQDIEDLEKILLTIDTDSRD